MGKGKPPPPNWFMGKGKPPPPNWFMGKGKPPKPAAKTIRKNRPPKLSAKNRLPNHWPEKRYLKQQYQGKFWRAPAATNADLTLQVCPGQDGNKGR
jgi:hypothetical protein